MVLGLLWSGSAYADKIYLNCKFLNGRIDYFAPQFSETINYSQDVTIDLDLKNNKILDGPHFGADSDPTIFDNSDEISWQHNFGPAENGLLYTVTLNRRNGNLNIWTLSSLKAGRYTGNKYYKCLKTEKKLF